MYYAFNTEEEAGVRAIEAAALFLSQRYSGGEYGLIHDWVIANEINQQKVLKIRLSVPLLEGHW